MTEWTHCSVRTVTLGQRQLAWMTFISNANNRSHDLKPSPSTLADTETQLNFYLLSGSMFKLLFSVPFESL